MRCVIGHSDHETCPGSTYESMTIRTNLVVVFGALGISLSIGACNPPGACIGDCTGTDTDGSTTEGSTTDGTSGVGTGGSGSSGDDTDCGNGVLDSGEDCDLGSANADSGGCTSQCQVAVCGDGMLYIGQEACDDGAETASCNGDCTLASCGDAVLNITAGESCDGPVTNAACEDCSVACHAGFADCNDDPTDGCEADLSRSATCGSCSTRCSGSQNCTDAGCCENACASDTDCGMEMLCDSGCCQEVSPVGTCDAPPVLTNLALPGGINGGIRAMTTGDFNRDQVADLVLGQADGAQLVAGGLSTAPTDLILPADHGLTSLVTLDFDVDGNLDIWALAQYPGDGDGALLFGDGAGGFGYTSLLPGYGWADVVGALDWNGDGDPDLVIAASGWEADIHPNDGQGGTSMRLHLQSGVIGGLATGPLNADSFHDVAFHDANEHVTRIFHGGAPGDGEADATRFATHGEQIRALTAAFLGGGATADLVAWAPFDSPAWILVQVSQGGSTSRWALPLAAAEVPPPGNPLATNKAPIVSDVDADGDFDVVFGTTNGIGVLFGSGQSSAPFTCVHEYATGHGGVVITVGDLDGVGTSELIASDGTSVTVLSAP